MGLSTVNESVVWSNNTAEIIPQVSFNAYWEKENMFFKKNYGKSRDQKVSSPNEGMA